MRLCLPRVVLIPLLSLCCWHGAAANAEETGGGIVMSSGIRGGGYWGAATRLQTVAAELGLEVKVLESRGSLHNLQQLDAADSPVSVTLTQADALQYYLDQHPALAEQGEILEHIGPECVYLISGKNSGIRAVADLQGSPRRVAIVSARSGVAVTFDYMKTLVPELADTEAVFTDTLRALEQLDSEQAPADAVMVVHRPKERSPEVERALNEPARYQFVEIADERLSKKLPNGDAVYDSLNLALSGGAEGAPNAIKTICMKGLLVSNKHKLTREQRYQLDDVLNYHWMRIYVPGS